MNTQIYISFLKFHQRKYIITFVTFIYENLKMVTGKKQDFLNLVYELVKQIVKKLNMVGENE